MQEGKVLASLYYLTKSDQWKTVKPYGFQYVPLEDIAQTNITREPQAGIHVRDLRLEKPAFDSSGIEVLDMDSELTYQDYHDPKKVEGIFLPHLRETLKASFDAASVHILEYRFRKRHRTFPVSTGEKYAYEQPVLGAHVDYTHQELVQVISYLYGDEAESMLQKRFISVNVWKPLKGPLRDWPLALCDASSVDTKNDFQATDTIFPTQVAENWQVTYNPDHRWYFLRDQLPSEILVFKAVDSLAPSSGVPHCSFQYDHGDTTETEPRESIEVRAVMFFDDH